jgi:ADP-heptose:LPS heptosyltransferase
MTMPSLADLSLTIPKYYDSSGKVLLHPGSGSRRKNWPLENFIRLNILLKKRGMFTTWVLGPAEHFMVNELKKRGLRDKEVHLIHDLLDFLDLLKHAAGFIGNDSGLSHLSAFLRIPVISIFGPSDPKRWRPIGPLVKVVRSEIDCQPCFETENANCESSECLYSILPERVDAEIDSKFEYTSINRQSALLS